MKERIEIYDDLVPLSIQDSIENLTTSKDINWNYHKNIVKNLEENPNLPYIPGFSHYLINLLTREVDMDYAFFYLQPLYLLINYLNLTLDKIIVSRLFFQIPSNIDFRLDPHVDMPDPHLVCLYYINDSDGDTIFFNGENEIKRVSPKKGRIVFFDGSIKHSAGIPKNSPRFILNTSFIQSNI